MTFASFLLHCRQGQTDWDWPNSVQSPPTLIIYVLFHVPTLVTQFGIRNGLLFYLINFFISSVAYVLPVRLSDSATKRKMVMVTHFTTYK